MNSNGNQMSSQDKPKKLDEITSNDIKDTALVYAAQFGVQASRVDCEIEGLVKRQALFEIGGNIDTVLPVSEWLVTINRRKPHVRRGIVTVEYLSGGVCAMDFRPF